MQMEGKNIKERIIYVDYLRVFATFAVVVLHVAAQNWYSTDVNGLDWQIFNFWDSMVRWAVPAFVMISGALFLDKDISIKKIYSKHILRLVISFCVWSLIYALLKQNTLEQKLFHMAQGHYHMWFMWMIIGIYMCIPFIKAIIEKESNIRYYLLLAFLFAFVVPETITLMNDFGSETTVKWAKVINNNLIDMNIQIVLGYASYFVLGYYLNKKELSRGQRGIIYVAGITGSLFTVVANSLVAARNQVPCSNYYGEFTVNVLLETLAVFTWFKYRKYSSTKWNVFIKKLSQYCFGVYMVHVLVLEQLKLHLGLHTLSFHSGYSVLIIAVVVVVISFIISAILNKVPIIRKYVV